MLCYQVRTSVASTRWWRDVVNAAVLTPDNWDSVCSSNCIRPSSAGWTSNFLFVCSSQTRVTYVRSQTIKCPVQLIPIEVAVKAACRVSHWGCVFSLGVNLVGILKSETRRLEVVDLMSSVSVSRVTYTLYTDNAVTDGDRATASRSWNDAITNYNSLQFLLVYTAQCTSVTSPVSVVGLSVIVLYR